MAFRYHFPSNSPAQSSRRRQLLDAYGQFAQLSAILLPLFLFLLFSLGRLLFKNIQLRRGDGYAALQPSRSHHPRKKLRQSPRVGTFPDHEVADNAAVEGRGNKSKERSFAASIGHWWARFRWALDEPVAPGWGTWREWSVAALWTAWLLVLTVKNTGDDYLHLTRRFGIVAASQLPLHYLLALKSWSPIQYLTRLSHEELNPYHRFLGRILTGLFLAHGLFYLNFYVQLSILSKRLRSTDVLLGLSALTTLLVLNSTALAKVRTWSYRLFFASHVLLSIIILPLLYFHVSHARLYVLEAAAIYIILIVQRNISSTSVLATITRLPGSPLLSICIPLTSRLARRRYYPGQHIYLSLPATGDSPLNKLRHHPFTIATLPVPSAAEMQLVIRPLRGTTQLLSSLAQPSQTPVKSQILIEGPYGASRCFIDSLRAYHRVLLVAGGVGATFTLPIYRHLLQQQKQQPNRPSRTNQKIRFVWSVRSIADASWGLEQLQDQEGGDHSNNKPSSSSSSRQQDTDLASHPTNTSNTAFGCDIYISSSGSSSSSPPSSPSTLELHSRPPPIPTSSSSSSYRIHTGRPNLKGIVDEIFSEVNDAEPESDTEFDDNEDEDGDGNQIPRLGDSNSTSENIRVAVLVCGPFGMGAALRREVGRWVRRGRGRQTGVGVGVGRRTGEVEGDGEGEGEGKGEWKGDWDVFWHDEEFGW